MGECQHEPCVTLFIMFRKQNYRNSERLRYNKQTTNNTVMDSFVHQVKIAPTPIQRDWNKITDTKGRFTSDYTIVLKGSMSLITCHNIY